MSTKEREAMYVLLIGKPGCGKTTAALHFVKRLGKERCLIIDPDGLEDKWSSFPLIDATNANAVKNIKGVVRAFAPEKNQIDKMFQVILDNFRNGLLVLDDCRFYVKSDVPGPLSNIFRRKRQLMVDIVAVAHGFTETPPRFFTFATHYILFRTEDNIARRKDVLPAYDQFLEIKNKVDLEAQKNKYYKVVIDKAKLLNT